MIPEPRMTIDCAISEILKDTLRTEDKSNYPIVREGSDSSL